MKLGLAALVAWCLTLFSLVSHCAAAPDLRIGRYTGALAGEIALTSLDGAVQRRLIGFGPRVQVTSAGEDTLAIVDPDSSSIFKVRVDGSLVHTITSPNWENIQRLASLPNGNLLVARGDKGIAETDWEDRTIWSKDSPLDGLHVVSGSVLRDGTVLMLLQRHDAREPQIFRAGPEGAAAIEVPFTLAEAETSPLQGLRWFIEGERLLLRHDYGYKVFAIEPSGTSFRFLQSVDTPSPFCFSVVDDELVIASADFLVERFVDSDRLPSFQTVYQPTSLTLLKPSNLVAVSYRRRQEFAWPDWRNAEARQPPFGWGRFAVFLVLPAGLLLLPFLRIAAKRSPQEECAAADTPRTNLHVKLGFRILTAVCFCAGLGLAVYADTLLRAERSVHEWLYIYLAGATMACCALLIWRRLGPGDSRKRFQFDGQRRDPLLIPVMLAVTACLIPAAAALALGFDHRYYPVQVGVWTSTLVTLAMLSLYRSRLPARIFSHLGLLALPLAVGCFTIFFRLTTIPANTHFDFTLYVLAAIDLIDGLFQKIWHYGFVPAPVIGTWPEMLSVIAFGPNQLGFRAGNALFGLSGIVAVYILGCTLRGRAAGFFAALLLAGNLAYFHFSRLPSNGVSATTALWVLTFFALALKTGHWRYWILCGLASGYTVYLWPVARVGPVSILAGGLILALLYPRRALSQWYGAWIVIVSGFSVIAPILPLWIETPVLAFPRVNESVTVFKSVEGFRDHALWESFGKPLLDSFSWFYNGIDRCTQGTLSPGFSTLESAVFSVGLAIALCELLSVNILLIGLITITLITCGAWATEPPYYTRLLPTAPIAAVLMAYAFSDALSLTHGLRQRWRTALAVLLTAGTLYAVPFRNFDRYFAWETGQVPGYNMTEMTAIGRRMQGLGPDYDYYLVTTHRPDWSVKEGGRFGELLPFIWNMRVKEIHDLERSMPRDLARPSVFFLQDARAMKDLELIRSVHHDLIVEDIFGFSKTRLAVMVTIPKQGQNGV